MIAKGSTTTTSATDELKSSASSSSEDAYKMEIISDEIKKSSVTICTFCCFGYFS